MGQSNYPLKSVICSGPVSRWKEFQGRCGFDGDREQRLDDMLRYWDVHAQQNPSPAEAPPIEMNGNFR